MIFFYGHFLSFLFNYHLRNGISNFFLSIYDVWVYLIFQQLMDHKFSKFSYRYLLLWFIKFSWASA